MVYYYWVLGICFIALVSALIEIRSLRNRTRDLDILVSGLINSRGIQSRKSEKANDEQGSDDVKQQEDGSLFDISDEDMAMLDEAMEKSEEANAELFVSAINSKSIIEISFIDKDGDILVRKCIPYDIAPSSRDKEKVDKFQMFNITSNHNLAVHKSTVLYIKVTDETFNPDDYVKWEPSWKIQREW